MPSPLAHIGLSWAFLAASRRPGSAGGLRDAAIVAFAAVAADFDLAVDLLGGDGIHFHHGPTHSIVFALGLAALLHAATRRRSTHLGPALFFAALLHAPLDWTTGDPGAPVKYGVTFFWPFSDTRYIAADPFFPPYHIDAAGGLANMFAAGALPVYLREAAVVAVGFALAGLTRRVRALRGPG